MRDLALKDKDKEVYEIIENEKYRMWGNMNLIASENYPSRTVLECSGSILTHKATEGYPGHRHYDGVEQYDKLESLCHTRACDAFHISPKDWAINCQALSAVLAGLVQQGGVICGLDFYAGGHLTHGAIMKGGKKLSASSNFFTSKPYHLNAEGYIDYDDLQKVALENKPEIIIAGSTVYSRDYDYKKFREIADSVNAYLWADIAHISGMVATKQQNNPFEYCDVLSMSTWKSLRGARGSLIFSNKKSKKDPEIEKKINSAVFPTLQGTASMHQIAGICSQLGEVCTPAYKEYISQVISNAKTLGVALEKKNYEIITQGTENHMILWDFRKTNFHGRNIRLLSAQANITMNSIQLHGDKSLLRPGGARLGTLGLTSRGFIEEDMEKVAEYLHKAAELTTEIREKAGKKNDDFETYIQDYQPIKELKQEVEGFMHKFPVPGIEETFYKKY